MDHKNRKGLPGKQRIQYTDRTRATNNQKNRNRNTPGIDSYDGYSKTGT